MGVKPRTVSSKLWSGHLEVCGLFWWPVKRPCVTVPPSFYHWAPSGWASTTYLAFWSDRVRRFLQLKFLEGVSAAELADRLVSQEAWCLQHPRTALSERHFLRLSCAAQRCCNADVLHSLRTWTSREGVGSTPGVLAAWK